MLRLWLALFAVLPLFGTETLRTFPFTRELTAKELEEIAGTIRAICEARTVMPQASPPALTVSGDEDLLTVAAWLVENLDKPSKEPRRTTYRGVPDGAVLVVFFEGSSLQSQNEIAGLVRGLTETRRLFMVPHRSAMVLRGSEDQVAAAAWLVNTLTGKSREEREYRPNSARDDVFRVMFFAADASARSVNEAAAAVRAMADVRRLMTYTAGAAIAFADREESSSLAAWLSRAFGSAPEPRPSEPLRYHYPDPIDDDTNVRMFYLRPDTTEEALNDVTAKLRRETFSRRILLVSGVRAIGFRGTAAQAALAEQIVKEARR
jgi:hypothetical protein